MGKDANNLKNFGNTTSSASKFAPESPDLHKASEQGKNSAKRLGHRGFGLGKPDLNGLNKLSHLHTPKNFRGSSLSGNQPQDNQQNPSDSNSNTQNLAWNRSHNQHPEDTNNLPWNKDKNWKDPDDARRDAHQANNPGNSSHNNKNQINPLKRKMMKHFGKKIKAHNLGKPKSLGKMLNHVSTDAAKGAAKKGSKSPKKAGLVGKKLGKLAKNAGAGSSPSWPWILGGIGAFDFMYHTAVKFMKWFSNNIQPFIQPLIDGLKDVSHFIGAGLKLAGHLVGGIFKGAAHLAMGAAHALLHPVAAASSAVTGLMHVVTGSATVSAATLAKVATIGAVCFGAYTAGLNNFVTKTGDDLGCDVEKVADDISQAITGANGQWTHKGTKAYNLAKIIYEDCLKLGMKPNMAAGCVANSEAEGAATGSLDEHEHDSDAGQGIFQFTPGSTGGNTLETYESWCHKHGKSPWGSAMTEIEGIMAIKGATSKLKHADPSSPAEGARKWYFSCEDGVDNGTLEHSYSGNPSREQNAQKAYSMFHGLDGMAGAADDNDASASSASDSACGRSQGNSDTDASDVKFAERYLGLPYQLGGNPIPIAEGKPKNEVDPTDCNKFAYACLRGAHYANPKSVPGNCDNSIQRLKKYEVPQSKAKAGTILITHWHAMIMMTPWRGLNGTKVIEEGGGRNKVNIASYEYSMASYLGTKRYYFNVPKE